MRIPGFFRRFGDLFGCLVVAFLVLVFAIGSIMTPLTVVLGGLLVFLVPGYALTSLLWHREPTLAVGDRIIFSVGLSVALTVLSVLLLSITGVGIYPLTVTLALAYESLVFGIAATAFRSARHQGIPGDLTRAAERARAIVRSDKPFWAVVAAILAAAVVLFTLIVATPTPPVGPEFYVLGPDGTTNTLPKTLVVNRTASVLVGATNGQAQSFTFAVTLCLGPANGTCPAGSASPASWTTTLSFAPNQTYVLNLSVGAGSKAEQLLRFFVTVPGSYALDLFLDGGGVHREARLPILVRP